MRRQHPAYSAAFHYILNHALPDLPDFPHGPHAFKSSIYASIIISQCGHLIHQCDRVTDLLHAIKRQKERLSDIEARMDDIARPFGEGEPAATAEFELLMAEKEFGQRAIKAQKDSVFVALGILSYIFCPSKSEHAKYDRRAWDRYKYLLAKEKAAWPTNSGDFAASKELRALKTKLDAEARQWASLRTHRGATMENIIFPQVDETFRKFCTDRDARDSIVHRDERIDFSSSASPGVVKSEYFDFDDEQLARSIEHAKMIVGEVQWAVHIAEVRFRNQQANQS